MPDTKRAALGASLLAVSAFAVTMPVALAAYDVGSDAYSMRNTTTQMGARAWWAAGYTGKGVDVALIDSGVSPVQGLDGSGKLVYGPDLSFESQLEGPPQPRYLRARHVHGGADRRPTTTQAPEPTQARACIAAWLPDARIVSLKVATADGGTDVTR